MFAAFLSTLLFSVSVICGHRSAKLIGGSEANFWRLTLAALFLGVWSFGTGVGLSGAALPMFLLSGIVGIGVGDVALFQTLPRLGSRLSLLLIHCLSAPFAALIEWLWMRTPLTGTQIVCGITILVGVGIALSPGKHTKLDRRELVVGALFAILGAVGNAFGAVLSRKAYAIAHENLEVISGHDAAFQRIVGGLAVAGICLVIVKRGTLWKGADLAEVSADPDSRERSASGANTVVMGQPRSDFGKIRQKWLRAGPWILVNSLAGQTLGVSFMQRAFETTPTGLVLAIIATTPIVVMPLAYFFEGEKATMRSVAGGIVGVVGVVLLIWSRSHQ
jgi:drug/metabolite transporter (DMT)-like permease